MDLDLNKLTEGIDAINSTVGSFIFEAAVICLEKRNGIIPGSKMIQDGDCKHSFRIKWAVDDIEEDSWNDDYIAIENGAYAIALLLVSKMTNYKISGRSVRGTGFDFWLGKGGESGELFQKKAARLEVSGILRGTDKINARINEKMRRTNDRPANLYDFYVIVVEFSEPIARVRKR